MEGEAKRVRDRGRKCMHKQTKRKWVSCTDEVLLNHLLANTGQAGSGDVDIQSLHVDRRVHGDASELEFRIARRRVRFMIFEPVEILIPFAANFAAVGLLLFHADCARVRHRGFGVNDGEGSVRVFV